jgi:hypothetical protein
MWGSAGTATAIWDFATEPLYIGEPMNRNNPPDCIDPGTSGSFMLPIFENNPAWSGGVLYSSIWFSVEVPAITSGYLTLRVQCHIAEGGEAPGSWEPQYMSDVSTFVDGFRCDADFWIDPDPDPVDNVLILEHTVSRDEGTCNPVMAAGGYIDYGEFTGIIVDIIVHDTPAPPVGGARLSNCFIPDHNSPMPDPPTWDLEPTANSPWSIIMTATQGIDRSNVQYYFEETSGNPGGTSSDWQTSRTYANQFLTPQTQYTYRVKMRDMSPQFNATDWSSPASATTTEIPSGDCPDGCGYFPCPVA